MLKHDVMLLGPYTLYSGGEVGQGRSPADSGFGAMWMDLSWRNPCLSLPWTMCPLPEEDLSSLASPICRMWATAQGTTGTTPHIPLSQREDLLKNVRSENAEDSGRKTKSHQRQCALDQPALLLLMASEADQASCMLGCPYRDKLPCATTSTMDDGCNKVTLYAVAAASLPIARPSSSQASFSRLLSCRSGSAYALLLAPFLQHACYEPQVELEIGSGRFTVSLAE